MDAKVHQVDLAEVQQRLAEWERQYGLTSAECEQRYINGEMGDSQDIIRWIHDYHSYKILLKNLKPQKAVSA